jgi:hypothetical protein
VNSGSSIKARERRARLVELIRHGGTTARVRIRDQTMYERR